MTLHVEIINPYPATTVKDLLETKLLIPRKIRHFLRTKKNVLINGEAIYCQSPVEKGDMIKLDFDGSVDGVPFDGGKAENYDLTVGSGSFIPGFEDQLVGVKIGEEVDVKVTFPEDYHAKDLAGKDAVFKCKVNEIHVKEVPEADDDFAQDISEFDTLAEYKEDIKKNLMEQKEKEAKAAKEAAVVAKVVENATMEIPDAMVFFLVCFLFFFLFFS